MNQPLSTRRAHATWKFAAGIVLTVTIFAFAVLGGLIAVGREWGRPGRISRQDRETLVVAAELAPIIADFVLRSDAEVFSKRHFLDGRTVLTYAYDHPDSDVPLLLTCRVLVAPNHASARDLYRQQAEALDQQAAARGYFVEDRHAIFVWGDASTYRLLREEAKVVGYLFAARKGEKVLVVELVGVELDEGQFGELVSPNLEALEDYQP